MDIAKRLKKSENFVASFDKFYETTVKSVLLLMRPLTFATALSIFWYFVFYQNDIHLNQQLEEIAAAAWIPTFGIMYSLLAAIILSTVWNEYKSMRVAIKRYDVET